MSALPLWHDGTENPGTDGAGPPATAEVVVVGAGIAGLATAAMLARTGRSVAVLEARTAGAGTTGSSTAKVSLLQGTRLSSIARKQPPELVRRYVEANRAAQEWLVELCTTHGVPLERRDAVTFAVSESGERAAREELAAARAAGLPVRWLRDVGLPFRTRGGICLEDQRQTDPVRLVHALLAEARAHGATVHEGVRVRDVSGSTPSRVQTDVGEIAADVVVLATGMPILDRGGFFARMKPVRSYALAFRGAELPTPAMYLSAEQPGRSLRDAHHDGDRFLLVGGEGHVAGRGRPEREHLDRLLAWTDRWWPGAEETHAWSAQDHSTAHGLPYAGPLLPGTAHLLVAGGFAKWGMTNGVAAAQALAAQITGDRPAGLDVYATWGRSELAGIPTIARLNASVGVELARGWLLPWTTGSEPGRAAAAGLSRMCTHLGGPLRWNDAEQSWDCPLHGSRFDADGAVLDGPATCGLRRS